MPIQLYCGKCRSYLPIETKVCPKCRAKIPTEGKRYRVDVSLGRKRLYQFTHSLTLAKEIESSLKADLLRNAYDIQAHKQKQAPTLDEAWARFEEWAKVNKAKSWTTDLVNYRKHLQPRFGNKPMDTIAPIHIEGMKAEMKREVTPQGRVGYADATVRHQLVLLNHIYRKARTWRLYLGENPVEQVRKPKLDNVRCEFLTSDEMERLLTTLAEWPCRQTANIISLAVFTGLRKGEILKLQWKHIDLERKTLRIDDPKGKVSSTIPLCDSAVEVLRNVPVTDSPYVFPGPDGGRKTTFVDPWHRVRAAAGLNPQLRFHSLRHNFASWLVSSGVDLYVVGKLLCHKDVKTSTRYAHLADSALRQAASKMDLFVTKPGNVVQLKGKNDG